MSVKTRLSKVKKGFKGMQKDAARAAKNRKNFRGKRKGIVKSWGKNVKSMFS